MSTDHNNSSNAGCHHGVASLGRKEHWGGLKAYDDLYVESVGAAGFVYLDPTSGETR